MTRRQHRRVVVVMAAAGLALAACAHAGGDDPPAQAPPPGEPAPVPAPADPAQGPETRPVPSERPRVRGPEVGPRRKTPSFALMMLPGESLRYRCTIEQHATTARVDRPEAASLSEGKQEAVVKVACVGQTKVERIYDVTFEAYRVWFQGAGGKLVEVDAGGPAPEKGDAARAAAYENARTLLASTLRVNTEPLGLVREATGAAAARGSKAAQTFWPFVHPELMKGTMGLIFSLKTDGSSPESADPWYVRVPVSAGASRTQVWETRALVAVAGDVATITGKAGAKGDLDEQERASQPVLFKEIAGTAEYGWNTGTGRLERAERTMTIVVREVKLGQRTETTAVTTTKLELIPGEAGPAAPAPAGVRKKDVP